MICTRDKHYLRYETVINYVDGSNSMVLSDKFLRYEFLSSDFLSSPNFGQVTDDQTQSDAYEPTVHMHRCAQQLITFSANAPFITQQNV